MNSVWVIESNGEVFTDTVGHDNTQRTRQFMYTTKVQANRCLTQLLKRYINRDKRKKRLNLEVVEYRRHG